MVIIMPTPRGVSSPTSLVLCHEGTIPRVGRKGIPITLIAGSAFLLSFTIPLSMENVINDVEKHNGRIKGRSTHETESP